MISPLFETKEIDPIACYYNIEIETREQVMSDPPEEFAGQDNRDVMEIYRDQIEDLKRRLSDHKEQQDKPVVTIKMFDALKLSQLRNRQAKAIDSVDKENLDLHSLELAQWGVESHKGITIVSGEEFAHEHELVMFDSEEHKITKRSVVKEYFRLGWLPGINREIVRLNTLQQEKKSK